MIEKEMKNDFAVYAEKPTEYTFERKIGNTLFEVTTHFSTKSNQSLLMQFKELLLSRKIV